MCLGGACYLSGVQYRYALPRAGILLSLILCLFFCRAVGEKRVNRRKLARGLLVPVSKTFSRQSSSRLLLGNGKDKAPQLAPLEDPQQTLAFTKYRTLPPFYKHVPYHHNHYVLDQHTMKLRKDHRVHMNACTS